MTESMCACMRPPTCLSVSLSVHPQLLLCLSLFVPHELRPVLPFLTQYPRVPSSFPHPVHGVLLRRQEVASVIVSTQGQAQVTPLLYELVTCPKSATTNSYARTVPIL